VPLQFSAKADEHHHTSRFLQCCGTSMILLSILLLPLGITLLCSVMAWTERMLDRPGRERFVGAAPDIAVIADRPPEVTP